MITGGVRTTSFPFDLDWLGWWLNEPFLMTRCLALAKTRPHGLPMLRSGEHGSVSKNTPLSVDSRCQEWPTRQISNRYAIGSAAKSFGLCVGPVVWIANRPQIKIGFHAVLYRAAMNILQGRFLMLLSPWTADDTWSELTRLCPGPFVHITAARFEHECIAKRITLVGGPAEVYKTHPASLSTTFILGFFQFNALFLWLC